MIGGSRLCRYASASSNWSAQFSTSAGANARPRRDNNAAIQALIEEWLAGFETREAALGVLERHRVPCAPVLTLNEAMAHPVIADSREAAMQESGDVILSHATVIAEIGEILGGDKPPPPAGSTIVFKSLGQAVTDAVAARLVYDAACKL